MPIEHGSHCIWQLSESAKNRAGRASPQPPPIGVEYAIVTVTIARPAILRVFYLRWVEIGPQVLYSRRYTAMPFGVIFMSPIVHQTAVLRPTELR
jgi:hypothetical protein